tara:strand:- start:3415 stop:4056 length:642 start_codon:yes stop_codon:yes gene_type:complete
VPAVVGNVPVLVGKKYAELMREISPCEPLMIDISDNMLSLCMQSLTATMDADGLLDPSFYFASLNIAWTGALTMAANNKNFSGYKFFQRLSSVLFDYVTECDGGFYFKAKPIHLRNMTEICKIQEENNYSLRFNCGGYGFSKLMWKSLRTPMKEALRPVGKDESQNRYVFILRLLHSFNQKTKDHDEVPMIHRDKLWALIKHIRRGEKLCKLK